jgi:DegV family protein with EDD domain
MPIALVTDSTCDLPKAVVDELGITVVPLYMLFGEESYKQDVDLDTDTFYAKQRASETPPKTSQPTPSDFKEAYTKLLDAGYDTIVSIHVSSDMSGTYRSAISARDDLIKDRGADIRIVDSRTVCLSLGLLVVAAAESIKGGAAADDVVKRVQELIPKAKVIFYVGTLEYLHRGGRIGTAKALLGALLSLKLMLQVKDGLVQPLAKARKKAKLFRLMADTMLKETGGTVEQGKLYAVHGDSPVEFEALLAELPEEIKGRMATSRVGGVVGSHSGPDVTGLAYFAQ